MADFIIAYKRTGGNEGGYSDVANDLGGETYCGITRKNFPFWPGWKIVDKNKPLKRGQVIHDPVLEQHKLNFYKENFWNPVRGDEILAQEIANEVYDMGVNKGPKVAIILLQRSMGYVPENGKMTNSFLKKVNNK